ncbi:MAG: glycoside hydrolase family 3 C-terminal domain-containing protein, partial [Anaerolineales bacterium]
FEMGLFENPIPDAPQFDLIGSAEHRAIAQEAVSQSLVLLKNDNNALPIPKDAKLFVAGLDARSLGYQLGGWSIEWQGGRLVQTEGTTILDGIKAIGGENVIFNRHGKFGVFGSHADIGIVIIGEPPYAEGAGDDGDLSLAKHEINRIMRVREQVDKLVVIIVSGRPLIITEHLDLADAWVAAWLPGTEGQGVAANLYGEHPFTGKLPVTWPASIEQLPLGSTDEEPLFPFGYGLTTD